MKLSTEIQAQVQSSVNAVREHFKTYTTEFTSPQLVKDFVTMQLATAEREHFMVLFLNNQHKLIADEIMFSGTIDGASVYPREVAKRALELNAAAVIFAHNHPSGLSEPSQSDFAITEQLKKCLSFFDVRVLDHIIVGTNCHSFAEYGQI